MRYCASASAYLFARYSALPLSSTTRASALSAPANPAVSSHPRCALSSDSGVFGAGSLPSPHAKAAATAATSSTARNALTSLCAGLGSLFRRRLASGNQRIEIHNNPGSAQEATGCDQRSEEHTSELQSRQYLVCR